MTTPIPRPPGVPVLGNIFDVNPNNPWSSLKSLAEKYGEIFQITALGSTIVFIGSAALATELCDETRFRKYVGGPVVEIRFAVHDALFTAYCDEPSWPVHHRIVAPQLHGPDAARAWFPVFRATAAELMATWRAHPPDHSSAKGFELVHDLNRLNLEATTLALYGMKLDTLTGAPHPMLQAMEDATAEAVKRPTRPGVLNWLLAGKLKAATATMRAYAADVVQHRNDHPTDAQDLLAALLHGADPETGERLTDSQVIDEIVSMPIGSSTAPCLIAAAVYFLLRNPAVLAAAREEVDRVVGTGPDAQLEHAHLRSLPYTEAVLRESLRLSFAAPGFNIEPIPRPGDTSPVRLAGGKYAIAHDQPMILVLAGVNRDPAVFGPDPHAFRPERMLGDRWEKLPVGARRWFGNGKRECVGREYAWWWSLTVLVMLVREVDFDMVDKGYKVHQDGWFNVRPVGFDVRARVRAV